jgi:hypothetical protein
MARQIEKHIDRQVIPTEPGSIAEIAQIPDQHEKKIAILDRKIKAKMMRSQMTHYGPTGWNLLEIDVKNTRARKAEREARELLLNPLGPIDAPVHLNWSKVDAIARQPALRNGRVPVPYGI